MTIFIYSNYLKHSLQRKDAYQIKNSIKASDFAVQITLPEKSRSQLNKLDSLEQTLSERWRHLRTDNEPLFVYFNFAYDIGKLEK